jgi:hypothetical protein
VQYGVGAVGEKLFAVGAADAASDIEGGDDTVRNYWSGATWTGRLRIRMEHRTDPAPNNIKIEGEGTEVIQRLGGSEAIYCGAVLRHSPSLQVIAKTSLLKIQSKNNSS